LLREPLLQEEFSHRMRRWSWDGCVWLVNMHHSLSSYRGESCPNFKTWKWCWGQGVVRPTVGLGQSLVQGNRGPKAPGSSWI